MPKVQPYGIRNLWVQIPQKKIMGRGEVSSFMLVCGGHGSPIQGCAKLSLPH